MGSQLSRPLFEHACAALRGERLIEPDWSELIGFAARTCMLGELFTALKPASNPPNDVQAFLGEVAVRNQARNDRLFDMLCAASVALNRVGIIPTALKGAALWVRAPHARHERKRILSDIDMLVRSDQKQRALEGLSQAGFECVRALAGEDVHVFAELARPNDIALIDLHQRPPGPPGLAEQIWRPGASIIYELAPNIAVAAPSAEAYTFMAVLHDQFHDDGYWTGQFHLRHLMDIACLTREASFDWQDLFSYARTGLTKQALEVQLFAAAVLMGAPAPNSVMTSAATKARYGRMRLQTNYPAVKGALAMAAALTTAPVLLQHRWANLQDRKRILGASDHRASWRNRVDWLRRIWR